MCPGHCGMACPQVVDRGYSLQIWKVAVNILNKQSWTANKRWSSKQGVVQGANNSSLWKPVCYTGPWNWTESLK